MFTTSLPELREQLLAIHGIGPETADAILLYAGGLPTFVVDTYAHRILARHGWIEYEADYHQVKDYFESELPTAAPLFNEYHALLVQVGKDYCKRTGPKCEECPELLNVFEAVSPRRTQSSQKRIHKMKNAECWAASVARQFAGCFLQLPFFIEFFPLCSPCRLWLNSLILE